MHEQVVNLTNLRMNLLQILLSLIKLNNVTTELLGIYIEQALFWYYRVYLLTFSEMPPKENKET